MRSHRPLRRLLAATVAAMSLAAVVGAPTLAAKPAGDTPLMHIEVAIDRPDLCGLAGFDAPGTEARVILKRDGAVLKDVTVPVFPKGGYFEAFWECGRQARFSPTIGDRVEASSGDQKTAVVLRDLRPRFNLVQDTLAGTAPQGRLEVTIFDCVIGLDCQGDRFYRFPRIGEDGTWSVDTNQFDLRGGDAVELVWSRRNVVYQFVVAPHVIVQHGSPMVTGHGTPGRLVTVTLEAANGTFKAAGSARVDEKGRFRLTLRAGGVEVAPGSGDVIRSNVFKNASIKVLADTLELDAETGEIDVRCRPLAQYLYRLRPGEGSLYASGGYADREGFIHEDRTVLDDDLPLAPTATVKLWCANGQGNSQRFFTRAS
jgi:hypothetical protein